MKRKRLVLMKLARQANSHLTQLRNSRRPFPSVMRFNISRAPGLGWLIRLDLLSLTRLMSSWNYSLTLEEFGSGDELARRGVIEIDDGEPSESQARHVKQAIVTYEFMASHE